MSRSERMKKADYGCKSSEPEREDISHTHDLNQGKKFSETRELYNGTFIEVRRSAKDIQRFCFQALEAVELSSEDLKVEVVEKI